LCFADRSESTLCQNAQSEALRYPLRYRNVAYQPVLEDAILPQPETIFQSIADLAKY
jgi:hypothetical protein